MLLRLDPEVHEALARWAADDLRSTNAHIEWLLRRAVTDAGRLRRPRRRAETDPPPAAAPTIKEVPWGRMWLAEVFSTLGP